MRKRWVAAMVLILGGCGLEAPEPEPLPPPPIATPIPKPKPVLLPEPRPAWGPLPAPEILGLSEADTVSLLGQPLRTTPSGLGKVLTYQGANCELEVHLFPDMEKGGFYALDYRAKGDTRDNCLHQIGRSQTPPPPDNRG